MVGKLKYFCIKEREVSEWTNYSEEKSKKEKNNKVIYINFEKVLTK